jgi:hypothetical protein
MFVESVIDDVRVVLGRLDDRTIFRRLTDAVRLGNDQAKFDQTVGVMDVFLYDGFMTVPPDVATILAVNQEGWPTVIRDQWFQFHVNGPGMERWQPWTFTDELGPVCTFRDAQFPAQMTAIVENPQDSNCELRVFGWDENDKRIYTPDQNGNLQDGFLVPTAYGVTTSNPAAPPIYKIDRIKKGLTQGYVQLFAQNVNDPTCNVMVGYYQPWETVPSYRRIRVMRMTWARIKYKRKDLEVRSLHDWINIDNRSALLLLVKSVKFLLDNQIEQAKAFETEGMRLLSNEADNLRPPSLQEPQVLFADGIERDASKDELYLHY